MCAVCTGKTITVNAAGGADFTTIQDAINDLNTMDSDEIVVAPGTYCEAINFLGKAVQLYSSGGPEITVIDGTGAYHVVQCISGEGPGTILEGFTITGGNASSGPSAGDYGGGGMYNDNSSPTVTGCIFTGNLSIFGGGMYNLSSSPTVTHCNFVENRATYGGGMHNSSSRPTVTHCVFSGNSAINSGGGMSNSSSSSTVIGCTFTGNSSTYGGGVSNTFSSPTVTHCVFSGNLASSSGGGMDNWDDSNPTVTGCTFTGNSSTFGGGMSNISSSPTVTNCTFSGNAASSSGGGMNNSNNSPTVTNCILWGDTPDEIFNTASSPVVTHCNVQGAGGTGNIDADPLFVHAAGGNLRLTFGSPCIDAANSVALQSIPWSAFDLDDRTRYYDVVSISDTGAGFYTYLDMGAYEFQCNGSEGDITCDGVVDLQDLAILAAHWLQGV
ncbi:MAG: right-handed parallel beta-helix repeat-containing protein [Anaerohalosphaeraceae bacterium]